MGRMTAHRCLRCLLILASASAPAGAVQRYALTSSVAGCIKCGDQSNQGCARDDQGWRFRLDDRHFPSEIAAGLKEIQESALPSIVREEFLAVCKAANYDMMHPSFHGQCYLAV
jgi:hypothetical protein